MKTLVTACVALLLLGSLESALAQDGSYAGGWERLLLERQRQQEQALIGQAEDAYRAKRYEDAARGFIAAIRVNPTDPVTIYNLACSLALLKQKEPALACLAAAWAVGFRDLDHIRKDRDFDSIRKTPEFKELIQRLEEAQEIEGLTLDQVLQRAIDDYLSERYEPATRALCAALERAPANSQILYCLARCFSRMNNPDVAVRALGTAWVAGFRDLEYIRRDPELDPIRRTPVFRGLMRQLAADLQRSRQAHMRRMQMFARQRQMRFAQMRAAQAQAFSRSWAGWGQGGQGSAGGGQASSWRSKNTDIGVMSDGNGFVGIIGDGFSYYSD